MEQRDSLDGVWRTEGYGYVFDIRGDRWTAYEVTSTTCVPGFIATRSGVAALAKALDVLRAALANPSP